MKRRLAVVICALGTLVTLWVSAAHWHELTRASSSESAGCVYCAGGMVAVEAPAIEAPAAAAQYLEAPAAPLIEAPARRHVLPLAHSGNAPPA